LNSNSNAVDTELGGGIGGIEAKCLVGGAHGGARVALVRVAARHRSAADVLSSGKEGESEDDSGDELREHF